MKDFDGWNQEKKMIHERNDDKLYNEREIWWSSLGVNVGFEQDGTGVEYQRPVLIVRGMSKDTCYVVPLTTSSKRHKYRINIGIIDGESAAAIMSQLRLIDVKRLVNKLCFLDQNTFTKIRKAARELF